MVTAGEITAALELGEDKDWEFKAAKGGLPGDLWPTYSAMANTDGGVVVLGIKQKGDRFEVQGLTDPAKMERDFWNTVNNRSKVSVNLLTNADVAVRELDGERVLVVRIPRADRTQRPVYVGQDPLTGTYRRFHEGDHLCSPEEASRMLADRRRDVPPDSEVLPHFGMDDLDPDSLRQYRNRFRTNSAAHPWLREDDLGLLKKLGGWRRDRAARSEGLTVAGLVMFGTDEALRVPEGVPRYGVDYREYLPAGPDGRWSDRIWPDGTWEANLFRFFERAYPKLVADLKVPFQFGEGGTTTTPDPAAVQRRDDTIVHEAIREALVNALIHADHRGKGGVIVERHRDRFEFSNPGSLLVSFEQLLRGGVSECRNPSLQTMFLMLGFGEKAGSGVDKIRTGWASQRWRAPIVAEHTRPDRVAVVLPMVSLLPEESLTRLRDALGDEFDGLTGSEVQALVTADVEGDVTNLRLQQLSIDHPGDITKLLQDLCVRDLLVKDGYGRWTTYRLSVRAAGAPHTPADDSTHTGGTPHTAAANSAHSGRTPHTGEADPIEDPDLLAVAAPSRESSRLPPERSRRIILRLCVGRFLTKDQIATLMSRSPNGLQERFLRPMAKKEELQLLHPKEPNHPQQAYRSVPAPPRPNTV